MELLNVVTARSVWLFDLNELNPRGKDLYGDLFDWLKERYNFEKIPESVTDLDETKALAFSRGSFQAREEIFVAVELKIYTDGLVANSWSSTRDTDSFLDDVLSLASTEFNLAYKPTLLRRRMYLSELNVRSEKELVNINPKLAQFANMITERIPKSAALPYEFGGVMFPPIHGISPVSIAPFRFDRKQNTQPDEHRYYSSAPVQTEDHLTLLDWFEHNLMG